MSAAGDAQRPTNDVTTGTYAGLNFATPGRRVRAGFERFGAAEIDVV